MKWKVGQTVMVQSRTWANINKPGGCAKITKIHTVEDGDGEEDDSSYVEGLDVKYVVGGGREKNLDPAIVALYEILERGGRSRRGRDFLVVGGEKSPSEGEKGNGVVAPMPGKENRTSNSNNKKANQTNNNKNKKAPPLPENMSAATCSTPEPPRHARKKLPTKVTPIPKMVVVLTRTTDADDISPMWMCADATATSSSLSSTRPISRLRHDTNSAQNNTFNSKSKVNNVARPLDFEASPKKNKASSKQHRVIPPPPTCLLPSKRSSLHNNTIQQQHHQQQQQRKRSRSTKLEKHGGIKHGGNDLANRKQPPVPLQERQHGGLMNSSKKKPPPSNPSSKRRQHPQQTQTQHQHPKAKTKSQAPAQASFSRATSAYSSAGGKASASKHKHRMPLKDVYKREKEMARKFMDEMVGAPRNTSDEDKNNNPKPRYQEFLSHLYKVWMKVDGEEEISEDRFRVVYHQITGGIFSATELETHLSSLCEEGRDVMRSDGMLYRIL